MINKAGLFPASASVFFHSFIHVFLHLTFELTSHEAFIHVMQSFSFSIGLEP